MSLLFVDIGAARLYLGDAIEVMAALEPVDCILTDPPYEKDAHGKSRRLSGYKAEGGGRALNASALPFPPMTARARREAARHMARLSSGWVLAFCQVEAIGAWRQALAHAGAAWRRGMVWVKTDYSPQLSGDRPAQGCEAIAAAWAGSGRSVWNGGGRTGVIVAGRSDPGMGHGGPRNPHPTQKPVALMRQLVLLFTQPGQLILDPYMGSGTTGVAAVLEGRRFVGVERDPEFFALACRRLEEAQQQLALPFMGAVA